jgi:hypothetical protein
MDDQYFAQAYANSDPCFVDPVTGAEFTTAEEQARGYGQRAADILRRPPPKALDPDLLRTVLGGLPPTMYSVLVDENGQARYAGVELAQKALYFASLAITYNDSAEDVARNGFEESRMTFAAGQGIMLALGYDHVARNMVQLASGNGALHIKFFPGRGDDIGITTQFNQLFLNACRANQNLFHRSDRIGPDFVRFFKPDAVQNVIALLVPIWPSSFCLGTKGNLTVLPCRPSIEVPFPIAPLPPVVQIRATNERPAPPIFHRGDRVRYQGVEYVVVDAGPTVPQRIGLRNPNAGDGPAEIYTTVHAEGDLQLVNAAQAAMQIQAAEQQAAAAEGVQPPVPLQADEIAQLENLQIPANAYEHQVEGIKWLWLNRRGVLGDEPGLGKTLQSVCATEFPALVVCPSKLKSNWLREFGKWRQGTVCAIISGAAIPPENVRNADVIIINYDILRQHSEWLSARGFKTIIVDEAHNLKNIEYRGVQLGYNNRGIMQYRYDVAESSPIKAIEFHKIQKAHPDARLYFLTGTGIMNARVREFFPLLNMVDSPANPFQMRTQGYGAQLQQPWQDYRFYCKRYCAEPEAYVRRARRGVIRCGGASNTIELNSIVTGKPIAGPFDRVAGDRVFMLRRSKALLNLPSLQRHIKHVSLSDEGARNYRQAVRDFVGYIRQVRGTAAAVRAALGAMLAKMNTLRRLAAVGKVEAVVDDILQFRNGTGRPLVVMAFHHDAMKGLIKGFEELNRKVGQPDGPNEPIRYGVIGWDGGANARDEALGEGDRNERQALERLAYRRRSRNVQAVVDAFQGENDRGERVEPTIDVVVMNIAVAVGITLTRASDMFFIERAWRPSDLEQAEGRIERIGQRNQMVVTYYDAPGTIDEQIANLLVHKARVIAAVLDGRDLNMREAAANVLGQLVGVEGDDEAQILENLADMLQQQLSRNAKGYIDPMPILNVPPE